MDSANYYATLYKQSPWLHMPSADWGALVKDSSPVYYKKGTVIYYQNHPTMYIYIVDKGRVNLSILSKEGDEKCLYIATGGCMFGEIVFVENYPNCAQATAMSDCYLYRIKGEDFMSSLSDTATMLSVLRMLSTKVRLLTGQLELLSFYDTVYRICELLDYLAAQYGVETGEGTLIGMRFTHQELANLAGATRVTITNSLNELEKAGIVLKDKGKYLIPDRERMMDYARTRAK